MGTLGNQSIKSAVATLKRGGVVCHACEGVWGFACNPFNPTAVRKILEIKNRDRSKGLIVIASEASKFQPELDQLPTQTRERIQSSWPGHTTWLLPNVQFYPWVTGDHATIAARVPEHQQALQLAAEWQKPLVSTSANVEGEPPCKTEKEAISQFGGIVEFILSGEIGHAKGPSQIIDAASGAIVR